LKSRHKKRKKKAGVCSGTSLREWEHGGVGPPGWVVVSFRWGKFTSRDAASGKAPKRIKRAVGAEGNPTSRKVTP